MITPSVKLFLLLCNSRVFQLNNYRRDVSPAMWWLVCVPRRGTQVHTTLLLYDKVYAKLRVRMKHGKLVLKLPFSFFASMKNLQETSPFQLRFRQVFHLPSLLFFSTTTSVLLRKAIINNECFSMFLVYYEEELFIIAD